jgi:S1-C subfamily serine protease
MPSADDIEAAILKPAQTERQALFDRRYKLLELRERRADRELRRQEIESNKGRGLTFTAAQATVAAAVIALLSAVAGGIIQGVATRDVEAGKNQALIAVEKLKAEGSIDLEKQKQDAAERLDRAKFETTLILKATEAVRREDQIRNLKFFLNAGFIKDPDGKIARIQETAFPSLPPPVSSTPADVFRQARGSIGRVTATRDVSGQRDVYVGTCFIVSNDGYALTAAHVVKEIQSGGSLSVTLGSISSYEYKASIVKIDDDLGVAIIKLSGSSDFTSLRISKGPVQIGDSATVMGFALGQDMSLLLGSFASLNILDRFLAITAPVSSGMSGAPVLDKNGDVVGIVRGGLTDRSVGVVVPTRLTRAMLAGIIND